MLALFDLDNTLIAGDSDHEWGCFLCEHGYVDADSYTAANNRFFDQYQAGTLNMSEFLEFALKPLRDTPTDQLRAWRDQFMAEKIEPLRLAAAEQLIQSHRDQGHFPLIITATNRFITEPIARMLGVDTLIATEPEMRDGRYTGRVAGTPCFQEGKIHRLQAWAAQQNRDPQQAWFYSDSANDLPLLERVAHPVAVDPDARLKVEAEKRKWKIISLRNHCP